MQNCFSLCKDYLSSSQDWNNIILILFDDREEHCAIGTIILMNYFKVHPLGSAAPYITNDHKEDNEYKLNMSKMIDNIIIIYGIESTGNNPWHVKHYSQCDKYPYARSVSNAMVETIGLRLYNSTNYGNFIN